MECQKGFPYKICTDPDHYALGEVLLQKPDVKGDDANDEIQTKSLTIGYLSKTLIYGERNYSTTEKDCLSVVWAL